MRRKYSTPVWIDTPLELYQQIKILIPAAELKVVYGDYAKSLLRTTGNSILLQLRKDFPLTDILKANRPYTSVAQLRAVLERQMAEIIRQERMNARKLVGHRSITEVYNTLIILQNKGFEVNISYFARNKIIILAEYNIFLPGSASPRKTADNLTNNSALLYLKLEFLKEYLENNPRLILNYSITVDEILSDMQDTFGSSLFGKIHTLQNTINSTQ
ncbi:MAG: hypothetical protein EOO61_01775 [Hymenobacter sp.]|nr:MAG: hypothetical protein EOO61_01775 [Hymenobacter sp.]